MDIAITSVLSHQDTQSQDYQTFDWCHLKGILNRLPSTYEVFDIYPERHEILLKILNPFSFNSGEILSLLQNLQEKFQRSFVALINIRSQSILITICD
ncbi:MAG: hypothetical protein ACFFC7_23395 [Candidatus Hermodarchaeota archaeon]